MSGGGDIEGRGDIRGIVHGAKVKSSLEVFPVNR